jgi:hypothetical protein
MAILKHISALSLLKIPTFLPPAKMVPIIIRKVEGPCLIRDPTFTPERGGCPLKDQKIALLEQRIADLKLAEISKPRSNWELQGIFGADRFCLRIFGREMGRIVVDRFSGLWPLASNS